MRIVARSVPVVAILGLLCAQQRPAVRPAEMERAIEEFRAQTRSLGLRADGKLRSGSNGSKAAWHGRLFEYFRNDLLDSTPHEIRQRGGDKSLLRRNQFGFNVAGPAAKRNTYFSFSYEGVRERISRTLLRTIPTLKERTGDYSQVVDQSGQILPIFDPTST